MRLRLYCARALAVAVLFAAPLGMPATAQESEDAKAEGKAGKEPTPSPTPAPAPAPATIKQRLTLNGKPIAYTATAGTVDLKDAKNETTARVFSVAYTADGADPKQRPVTFLFNGGPGSASLWLHMGSFGPMRVETPDAQPAPPPPYRLVENTESLLDRTDLVFVDAVGTGFSRIVGKGEPKDFYGTDQDVAAFAQFIERWVAANNRWNSPKFLLGESYGTTRGAALLLALERKGMAFNGADFRLVLPERLGRLERPAVRQRPRLPALPADPRRDRLALQEGRPAAGGARRLSRRGPEVLPRRVRAGARAGRQASTPPPGRRSRRSCTPTRDSRRPTS